MEHSIGYNNIDSLTGLLNIHGFREESNYLHDENYYEENPLKEVYVIFDIVSFKAYNELHGFDAGNMVLISFAEELVKAFPDRVLARVSGDHFAAMLFDEEVKEGVARLKEQIEKNPNLSHIHFRCGVYYQPDEELDTAICIDRAKAAADSMRGQSDVIRVFDKELEEEQNRTIYISENIDQAIESGYIEVYYQPVIRSLTGELCGMEALARWNDPQYGMLSPGVFIPILESKGLIYKLDSYMVRRVCKDLRTWMDAGQRVVPISFNFTRIDFEFADMLREVEDAATKYQIPRDLLHIEITESTISQNERLVAEQVKKFHAAGYSVWMDDFGSGYSSLNVLKDYDFDLLKIDMRFLSNFTEKSKSIITSIVQMAKALGIHTLAEGVETEEHVRFLQKIGCERQQGFYYSKPVPCDLLTLQNYENQWKIEAPKLRNYYDELGLLDDDMVSRSDFINSSVPINADTDGAVACFEYNGENYHFLTCTDTFRQTMEKFGFPALDVIEDYINQEKTELSHRFRMLMDQIRADDTDLRGHWIDISSEYKQGLVRVRKIVIQNERTAYVCMIENLSDSRIYKRIIEKNAANSDLSMIFDRVDIYDLKNDTISNLSSRIVFSAIDEAKTLHQIIQDFAVRHVYPDDRQAFVAMLDLDTLVNRIVYSDYGYISDCFRVQVSDERFVWLQFFLVREISHDDQIVCCIKYVSDQEAEALYDYDRKKHLEQLSSPAQSEESIIHRSELWDTLMLDKRVGYFWKDKSLRYVGANKTFFEYCGFSSSYDFVGKTDEELGITLAEGFVNEQDIIARGKVMNPTSISVMDHGILRHYVVAKRPIYRNGYIVGLLGYFLEHTK